MTFDVPPYEVTLEGISVTIMREEGLYAVGTWNPTGGYVHYLYDGPDGTYDWRLFDRVDKELRDRTNFRPILLDLE